MAVRTDKDFFTAENKQFPVPSTCKQTIKRLILLVIHTVILVNKHEIYTVVQSTVSSIYYVQAVGRSLFKHEIQLVVQS